MLRVPGHESLRKWPKPAIQRPRSTPIDSLVVEVITDDVSDAYVSKTLFAVSEFSNVVLAGAKVISGETLLCANLGFGLRLVSQAGEVRHTLLFDTGPEGDIFIRNCANLGIHLGEVEAIAVSHGHWDHMAALPHAVDAIVKHAGQVTVHVNPGMFNDRAVRLKSGMVVPVANVPLPADLEQAQARWLNDPDARLLLDGHFYYSGEIPRVTSFEKGRVDHLCRKRPGGPWEPDPLLMDERMLVAHVRDLGSDRLQRVLARRHRQRLHPCPQSVSRHPDLLRDGRAASRRRHGKDHSGHRGRAAAVSHPGRSSPATARGGGRCMRWPMPSATPSASPPSARNTPSTRRTTCRCRGGHVRQPSVVPAKNGRVGKIACRGIRILSGNLKPILPSAVQAAVAIVAGFTRQRKDTLVERILTNQHGLRTAVIVNEFSDVGIDGELIVSADDDMVELENGCICCSINNDFMDAIFRILGRERRVDHLVVETTGVADPLPVVLTCLRSELRDLVRLNSIVTIADAASFCLDHFESGAARNQLRYGDVVLLNKCDLAGAARLQALEATIRTIQPGARILRTTRCEVSLPLILTPAGSSPTGFSPVGRRSSVVRTTTPAMITPARTIT